MFGMYIIDIHGNEQRLYLDNEHCKRSLLRTLDVTLDDEEQNYIVRALLSQMLYSTDGRLHNSKFVPHPPNSFVP